MYLGSDPRHVLGEVLREQEELRGRVWQEAEARRASRSFRGRHLKAFKLWRLHVMVWIEDGSRVS